MTSAVETGPMPDHSGVVVIAAAGGQRVVLVVDEHCFDVTGTDASGLQGDDLAVGVAVGQESEPGALEVPNTVEGLAHASARWEGVGGGGPRWGAAPPTTRARSGCGVRGSRHSQAGSGACLRVLRPCQWPVWSVTAPQAQ